MRDGQPSCRVLCKQGHTGHTARDQRVALLRGAPDLCQRQQHELVQAREAAEEQAKAKRILAQGSFDVFERILPAEAELERAHTRQCDGDTGRGRCAAA